MEAWSGYLLPKVYFVNIYGTYIYLGEEHNNYQHCCASD